MRKVTESASLTKRIRRFKQKERKIVFMSITVLILTLSALILLMMLELFCCRFKGQSKKATYCIGSMISLIIIFLCWWSDIKKEAVIVAVSFVCYFGITITLKLTTSFFVLGKNDKFDLRAFIDLLCYNIQLFLMSPDYVITKVCKDIIWQAKDDRRKKMIQCFNIENLLLSIVLINFVSSFAKYVQLPTFNRCLIVFLIIRIVSRSVEIVISFVNDVCSSERKVSSLNKHDRIALAFTSILELVVLSIGIGYSCNPEKGISNAVFEALNIIGNLPSSEGELSCDKIAMLFNALGCFTLIGTVISSYIGESGKDTNK